eukprot:NODE_14940_length_1076_cov_23.237092.p2 GENE.NODE_14940_length_1076_cov_23.237092~~NODE_14940_length_1076_cov_23.237092.p2  ORF type:complete len:168 (+),score=61.14 NODE_14940_length_1076_cov_23.237092:93-596(+)
MKPDWDKLMKNFADSEQVLIADVDCTSDDGKALCEQHGVKGYPTILHGDPSDLQKYEGARDYKALNKFATNMKPGCSVKNVDLCDDEKKEQIKQLLALSRAELEEKVDVESAKIEVAEKHFTDEVQKLQDRYGELEKEKAAAIQAVKDSGLGIMKSVLAAKPAKDEL